jgi:hypothetical protein
MDKLKTTEKATATGTEKATGTNKQIVTEIKDRNVFFSLLKQNPGLIIIKLGATWCGPCKMIKKDVDQFFLSSPPDVICCDLDVDECFDLYSMLQSKRMVNGVPALLCYKQGNHSFAPDYSVTGADKTALHQFFAKCSASIKNNNIAVK